MTTRAELTDGRIIELTKECECLDAIHTGPHWLHMDDYERTRNLELLDMAEKSRVAACTFSEINMVHALLNRFAELEIVRLNLKRREMQLRRIVRLLSPIATETEPLNHTATGGT